MSSNSTQNRVDVDKAFAEQLLKMLERKHGRPVVREFFWEESTNLSHAAPAQPRKATAADFGVVESMKHGEQYQNWQEKCSNNPFADSSRRRSAYK